eukprot:1794075-Amphidinium_carterae.1
MFDPYCLTSFWRFISKVLCVANLSSESSQKWCFKRFNRHQTNCLTWYAHVHFRWEELLERNSNPPMTMVCNCGALERALPVSYIIEP